MKKGNKLTAAVTASAVMAAMVAAPASAAVNFNDINDSFAKDAILKLAELGILNGKAEGTFDPTGNVTRAEFAKILVLSLGLKTDDAPAAATFTDVAADHWSYKFVEAAAKAKLINGLGDGKFGPSDQLTREQMATLFVRALGTDVAGKAANLTFADKGDISSYAADAVAYAVELGLVNGVGGNAFNPQGTATREAVAKVANLFLDKIAPATLVIEGDANVGIGEKVTFSVKDFKGAVTWSVSGNGVIDQTGTFVGNAAGKVTVTATANGKSVSKQISVYGAAASVAFAEPKELVANDKSTQEITLNVVDANGNAVENFNGLVDLELENGGVIAFVDADGAKEAGTTKTGLKIVNGVLKFTVASNTTVPGLSETIKALDLRTAAGIAIKGYEVVSTEVSTVDQVATAVKVSPEHTTLQANGATVSYVDVTIVDQDGKDMVGETHGLKLNISGPGVFLDGGEASTKEISASIVNGVAYRQAISTVKGKAGNIVITVTSEGLTTGTTTIKSAVAEDADKLVVKNADSKNTNNEIVQGADLEFTVGALDANAIPLNDWTIGSDVTVYITKDGKTATNLSVNGTPVSKDGVELTGTSIEITDNLSASAGTYKLVVKDKASSGALKAADEVTFTLKADKAENFSLSQGTDYIAASAPNTTFSVQVTDQFGNSVKKSGVEVTFAATSNNSTTKAAFNGKSMKTGVAGQEVVATVATDAEGKATVEFASQGYNGTVWTIAVDSDAEGFDVSTGTKTVTVVTLPTASLKVDVKANADASVTRLYAGTHLYFNLVQKDAYGATIETDVENDKVKVTVSNPSAITWSEDAADDAGVSIDEEAGTITGRVAAINAYFEHADIFADKAGTVNFTITDVSIANAKSTTASIRVWAGEFDAFALFSADGKLVDEVTVEANKEIALTLKPVDAQGNPLVAGEKFTVALGDGNEAGIFREVSGGAPKANGQFTFANGATSKTVYYVNATAGTYTLDASVVVIP